MYNEKSFLEGCRTGGVTLPTHDGNAALMHNSKAKLSRTQIQINRHEK